MKTKRKKPLKFTLIVIALALLVFSYVSFSNSKKENGVVIKESPKNDSRVSESAQKNTTQEGRTTNTNSENNNQSITEEENQESPSTSSPALAKSQIIDYINNNVNNLAPAPPNAGVWKVNRYWFSSNNNVYVEYESDGELRQMLISVDTSNANPAYTRKATFKAGESSWVLTEGEDTQFGKTRELYEKAGEEWVKKN